MELFKKKEPLEIIQDKYKTYNAALAEATEAVETAENKVADAKIALETAADQNDATAFSAAKKQLADAETALEMATMRKDRIISRGPCPKEEVDSAIAYYNQQTRDLDRETAVKLVNLYDQIAEIGKSAESKKSLIAKNYKELMDITGRTASPFDIPVATLRSIDCLHNNIRPLSKPSALGNGYLQILHTVAGKK